MNKSALKSFATEARRELLEKVQLQARKLGITPDAIQKATLESSDAIFIDGKQLSDVERKQRNKLIARLDEIGYDRVMEEAAYTWFNRFIALRYMEVNDYLPTKVRVLSSVNPDSTEPDMMKEALNLDLPIDKEFVYNLKIENKADDLFKYLIKVHCNDLNRYMPFMFETIEGYTDVLFPEGMLRIDSFVRKMTDTSYISKEDWFNAEIVGWLYQYYISEEKDEVFLNLKKNIKITKENIPAATQLFTPNGVVRYLVENSLGRIWLNSYTDTKISDKWKYYLEEPEQEKIIIQQLQHLRNSKVNPEEITFLDPCCGSGHILIYAFEIFYDMYLEKGYFESDIPHLILEKNLFGLDIDNRATQLASFAVLMKARGKSRKIFRKPIIPKIYSIEESNWLSDDIINTISTDNDTKRLLESIGNVFIDAKEYGSILKFEDNDYGKLEDLLNDLEKSTKLDLVELNTFAILKEKLPSLINQAKILLNQYDVVCTNPPYMGHKGMDEKLLNYLKKYYPDTKSDLSTVLMEKCLLLTKEQGFISIINIPVWMFLQSYKNLREKIIENNTIINMVHYGRGVFGSDFGTTAFVISKSKIKNYISVYRRLFVKQGAVDSLEQKEKWFFEDMGYYVIKQEDFYKIPGTPISYWGSNNSFKAYEVGQPLGLIAEPKQGLATADNKRFVRQWYEVSWENIGFGVKNRLESIEKKVRWFPFNNGGDFRKWYGNNIDVVNWENDGEELKQSIIQRYPYLNGNYSFVIKNESKYFKKGITWNAVTSGNLSLRAFEEGFLFSNAGMAIFEDETPIELLLAYLNSKVVQYLLSFVSSTLNFNQGDIKKAPIILNNKYENGIIELSKKNIEISKEDWDSFEVSWGFVKHPIITHRNGRKKIQEAYSNWEDYSNKRFSKLKSNEEEINAILLKIYDLEDEMSPEIDMNEVSIRKADYERDIKSYISYAIGCFFGRYSLEKDGLLYKSDENNPIELLGNNIILPITQDSYFEEDIVTYFVEFVRTSFIDENLEENLEFIANAIGRKSNETAREALRRYFLNEFYKNHLQVYQKRPIYWLFTSGKEKAFNCLIYIHQYDKTTLSRIRTDYVHEAQNRMDAEKNDLLNIINGDSTVKEIATAKKELKSLEKKIDELKKYDELLHHMADQQIEIDLDDGVKHNYELFKGLVAPIK